MFPIRPRSPTVVFVTGIIGLAVLGWTAAQRWVPRWRAERTALAYARAAYRQDTVALKQLTASGSAHNSLCVGRWSLGPQWGPNAHPRVLKRVGWGDTVEYHVGSESGLSPGAPTFVFLIALQQPGKVVSYHVPSLPDSITALAFHTCAGWPEWPRVRGVLR